MSISESLLPRFGRYPRRIRLDYLIDNPVEPGYTPSTR